MATFSSERVNETFSQDQISFNTLYGSSGFGSSSSSSSSLFFRMNLFVTKAIVAVPIIAHATPMPIATARPEDWVLLSS